MNIVAITSSYPRHPGDGVGSFIHSLSLSLTRLGHRLTIFAPFDSQIVSGWPPDVNVKRIRYIWPNRWSVLGHARSLDSDVRLKWHAYPLVGLFGIVALSRLWSEVLFSKADVIHAHWLLPGGLIGAMTSLLSGVPLVISLHGSDVFVAERYALLKPVVRLIFRRASHVTACSTDLLHRAIGLGLLPDRATVIPYGVDATRYTTDIEAVQTLQKKLSISPTQLVIMAMGRLVYKKGFSYLLYAMPYILEQFPHAHLLIGGEGDLRSELEALAVSLGVREQVTFTGHIPWDQTPIYLAMADVFVVPSIQDKAGNVDGLPNVLLESMAAGCPVVGSRIAGIPEIINHEQNGLLVLPGDEQVLAAAICRLLADKPLRQRLSRAAQKSVVDDLSWSQIGYKMANILNACNERNR